MALTEEFVTPEFLENLSVDEVHSKMTDSLPVDIDKSQGQFAWDMTRPSALEFSYFGQFVLLEAIKQIFPMFSYGDFLDYHGDSRNIFRKAATFAIGYVTVAGDVGTEIPAGSIFSTEKTNDVESIDYKTVSDAVISADSTVNIPIICVTAGKEGNVAPGTIILNSSNISGLTDITNEEYTYGGTDMEEDDDLRERIVESDHGSGNSFIGCDSDYKRWTLEVEGTGSATVIPAKDDSGLITIVLLDANSDPASSELCTEVYNHIVSPDDRSKRLAPLNGANLSVVPPQILDVSISATIEIISTTTVEAVKNTFFEKIKSYLLSSVNDGEIRISKIGSILSATDGIKDYSSLTINDGTANIAIEDTYLPVITLENITFTEGNV